MYVVVRGDGRARDGTVGAGKLLYGAAGPLALGRGEFVQADDAHRVIE